MSYLINIPAVQKIFRIFKESGEEIRIVGGAVRNNLMALPHKDIDFATIALPDQIIEIATKVGIQVIPTGLAHGTITLVIDSNNYEVTTLRKDVETDGRHATVEFTDDWEADANRRDFTMNGLFMDSEGEIIDYVGGIPDCIACNVQFIGNPADRIKEDYLRILRFFRFHAEYGIDEKFNVPGLVAIFDLKEGLRKVSSERVSAELHKLVVAQNAHASVVRMNMLEIFPVILDGQVDFVPFRDLVKFEEENKINPNAVMRLMVLAVKKKEDIDRLRDKLKLPNDEVNRMTKAINALDKFRKSDFKESLYRLGTQTYLDTVKLSYAWSNPDIQKHQLFWKSAIDLPRVWSIPKCPVTGWDLIQMGMREGPNLGSMLELLEEFWIKNDFKPDNKYLIELAKIIP